MDAIHYKVKEDQRYVTKAAYVVLGITMDGRKDILGVWIGERKAVNFGLMCGMTSKAGVSWMHICSAPSKP